MVARFVDFIAVWGSRGGDSTPTEGREGCDPELGLTLAEFGFFLLLLTLGEW